MNGVVGQPLVVALAIEDDTWGRRLRRALEGAGCEVQAAWSRAALVDRVLASEAAFALVIAEAAWLAGSPFDRLGCGPPVLAVQREGGPPVRSAPIATARVRIAPEGAGEDRIAHLARHLIEQDRRWRGAWISTGLLQLPTPPRRAPEGERSSEIPPSE